MISATFILLKLQLKYEKSKKCELIFKNCFDKNEWFTEKM